ncbi:MAG: thiamine phosphate synthase, partial [Xanthomonadales bacterium]|nr:thiamine phosphate synthase [Xanthomonadales bacterium]
MSPMPSHGLYAITRQAHPDLPGLLSEVRQALAGGAAVVQFRDKSGDARWRLEAASSIRDLCRAAGIPLIVNDDVALAKRAGADGVHIGRHDGDVAAVREAVGPGLLLGVSCYTDIDRARAAVAAGADYVAFGSFYPSETKPGAVHCGFDVLREARGLEKPLVAIGG